MRIVIATVASNANVDLREFAESLDGRNPAIRIVKANRKSLRVEYGPLPGAALPTESELDEYLADIRAWFGACLIQIGLASSNSGAFLATPKIRACEPWALTDSAAYRLLEFIADAPNAGRRRGWAWSQMRHCERPSSMPLAA